jgi:peptidyl-tRNA hydrolase
MINITPPHLRNQAEQSTLPIIVRQEKGVEYTAEDLFSAVSTLMHDLMTEETWEAYIEKWMQGRITKIVKRARGNEWLNLLQHDHLHQAHGNVETVVLKPYLKTEQPTFLRKLQMSGLVFEPATPTLYDSMLPALNIAVNPELDMSVGKLTAQVAHAAQIAVLHADKSILTEWVNTGKPFRYITWDSIPENCVDIQDAGLTEIAPGSFTTRSYFNIR